MSTDIAAIVERARLAAQQPATAAEPSSAERDKLKQIAAEFESMLLVQVLKDMRKAGSWEEEGAGGGDTLGAESLFEALDVELASHLAKVKGMGLGRQLEDAFDRLHPASSQPAAPEMRSGLVATPADATKVESAPKSTPEKSDRVSGASARQRVQPAEKPGHDVVSAVKVVAEKAAEAPGAVADLLRPVAGAVTSAFGWRRHPITKEVKFHQGVDLRAAYGQEVQAAAGGTVVFSGERGGYGSTVEIQHKDGTTTRYAHLSARLVKKGDEISAGESLGRAGRSGRATGTHLHFEVIAADGQRVQPEQWAGGRAAASLGRTLETHGHAHEAPAVGNPPVMTVARSIKARTAGAD